MTIVFLVLLVPVIVSVCTLSYKHYKKKKAELDEKYYKHLREPMH